MAKPKSAGHLFIHMFAFGLGLVYPFVAVLWKVIILLCFLMFRVFDVEQERKRFGAVPLFFIGMIVGFTYRLIVR